ncbi:hypothetical protein F5Y10DRAFT_197673 [Nemania abortiva]|nr:hypothetical protein F5Y10DRAFT_197673 [Nemania abortiva]
MANPSQGTANKATDKGTDKGTVSRRTVSDYNLVRKPAIDQLMNWDVGFMELYLGPAGGAPFSGSWKYYTVTNSRGNELNLYAVSTVFQAYVTDIVFLTFSDKIGSERYTDMRYRDMMVDNYLAAGGDLKTWRYIGARRVVNEPTVRLAKKCFERAGPEFVRDGATLEFRPGDAEFETIVMGNPFTRGLLALLREYEKEMGNAKIKRFTFISLDPYDNSIHLVIELYRPGDAGYPSGKE